MSIAFHLSVEGDTDVECLAKLQTLVRVVSNISQQKRDGTSMPVKMGDVTIGVVSVEDESRMNVRMRLRRVGPAVPAFEREQKQYGPRPGIVRETCKSQLCERYSSDELNFCSLPCKSRWEAEAAERTDTGLGEQLDREVPIRAEVTESRDTG